MLIAHNKFGVHKNILLIFAGILLDKVGWYSESICCVLGAKNVIRDNDKSHKTTSIDDPHKRLGLATTKLLGFNPNIDLIILIALLNDSDLKNTQEKTTDIKVITL